MKRLDRWVWLAGLSAACAAQAAETELIHTETPWRTFLVVGPKLEKKGDGLATMDRTPGPGAPRSGD